MLASAVLLAFGCGPRLATPECVRGHDACLETCADRCEARGATPHGSGAQAEGGDVYFNDPGCSACIDDCKRQAARCEERAKSRSTSAD